MHRLLYILQSVKTHLSTVIAFTILPSKDVGLNVDKVTVDICSRQIFVMKMDGFFLHRPTRYEDLFSLSQYTVLCALQGLNSLGVGVFFHSI